ncbi:MAG: S24/S26 family peptidase [Methylocystis sp.]|nr:S24/S26 family peptidase [Methylocystis sp.]
MSANSDGDDCGAARREMDRVGRLFLTVRGASMVPALWPDDLLEVLKHDFALVAVGQVILFESGDRLVTHRVASRRDGLLHTRGDAAPHFDAPVASSHFLGVVALVMRNGRAFAPPVRPSWPTRFVSALLRRSGALSKIAQRARATLAQSCGALP